MKKVTFLMALAVAAGMASCTAQSPKADLKTDIDSLSYAIGMHVQKVWTSILHNKALTQPRCQNS